MLKLIIACLLFSAPAYALEFASPKQMATVIELYTSEGCSSCPPAESWLSDLGHDPRLFHTLIPMAFHVDYWDQLGWKDRFSQHVFTQRQQDMVKQGILSQVYTPGIVVNNQEWAQWFRGQRQPPLSDKPVGILQVSVQRGQLDASFPGSENLALHVAYLGMGLHSTVTAGENKNRRLQHDFVVLQTWQQPGKSSWHMTLPKIPQVGQQQTAIVVWMTPIGSLRIIQATGHLLAK